jgi:hypothetical protein
VILQKEEGCDIEPYINANFIKVNSTAKDLFARLIFKCSHILGTGLCI